MKKRIDSGFMLVETLIVTIFVSGVLLFLFIQFSNLSKSYDESFNYNTVEDLYLLNDIVKYIESESNVMTYIENNINTVSHIDLTDCTLFSSNDFCSNLFELANISQIFVSNNNISPNSITEYNIGFKNFIDKIKGTGNQKYRLVASFKNNTYATLRFGD